MNKAVVTLVALLVLASQAFAGNWAIDTSHSEAAFKVRHMMITDVRGSFPAVSGTVAIDENDITKSTVNVEIDAASISTGDNGRDGHLKSADFFDVEKFPKVTFVSKKVKKAGNGLQVTGDLTMHGVTRSVVLDVDGPTESVKGPWGKIRKGATATTKLNRKDYGITWNAALDNGGVLVGDDVLVSIDLQLIAQ